MNRILEVIFRRPLQLVLLLIMLPLVSLLIVYFQPRSYQTIATLWALQRYQAIGVTEPAVDPQTNTAITPAQSQVNTLIEFLQTRNFAVAVAKSTDLATTLHLDSSVLADPERLADAYLQEIAHHVQVAAQGYDQFTISYTNRDPGVAEQVVESVIQNYGLKTQELFAIEGQNMLKGYQAQLAQAQQDLVVANLVETRYLQAHPGVTSAALLTDPQYETLHAEVDQKETTVVNILNNIATVNQEISLQGSGGNSLFAVRDAPQVPLGPVGRLPLLLIAGPIGLGAALFACALYIFILVRRDRAVYTALDLQKLSALPVMTQLPHLKPTTMPLLMDGTVNSNSWEKPARSTR